MKGSPHKVIDRRGKDVLRARRRVLRKSDMKGIHDLRVATRRLQAGLGVLASALPVKERRRLERRARALRRCLGDRRNAAVLLKILSRLGDLGPSENSFVARLTRRLDGDAPQAEGAIDLPGIRKRVRAVLRNDAKGDGARSAQAAWKESV